MECEVGRPAHNRRIHSLFGGEATKIGKIGSPAHAIFVASADEGLPILTLAGLPRAWCNLSAEALASHLPRTDVRGCRRLRAAFKLPNISGREPPLSWPHQRKTLTEYFYQMYSIVVKGLPEGVRG
jgi:hypothetical protein